MLSLCTLKFGQYKSLFSLLLLKLLLGKISFAFHIRSKYFLF